MIYLGLISGTSMDGIDVAALRIDADGFELLATGGVAYEEGLQSALRHAIAEPRTIDVDALGDLDVRVGEAFAGAACELASAAGIDLATVTAIGSHGQTLRHRPDATAPFTLQVGDPNVIAARTGVTVVADFRRRDVALGGEGAPLLPPFHRAAFASDEEDRTVVNVGGIANVTLLPRSGRLSGFDTGPGNCLLDEWIAKHGSAPFDRNGDWARSGRIDVPLLAALSVDDYFDRAPPKSTGREHFNLRWLDTHLAPLSDTLLPEDVQATLVELTASRIAAAAGQPARLIVCGGGAHNGFLLERLGALLPGVAVDTSAAHGLDPDWVEAAAFAWLAHRTLAGLPGNAPSVTGAREAAVLGAIYAGGRG